LSSIPNLLDIFTKMCKPASEMKTMLENYLAVDPKGEGSSSSGTNHTEVADEVVDTATAQSVEDQFAGL
jgi:hypothetical protein